MFSKKIKYAFAAAAFSLISSAVFADPFFSGIAGGKFKLTPDANAETTKPSLTLQAFIAGQLNFSQNIWSHMEFTIDTQNLISETLFDKTDSLFQVNELSIIFRQNIDSLSNYFSAFMGTYDPIGSDIFLQRMFGISPITSKITESWLGMAGSLLYPHFGAGISDVIKLGNPYAIGIYAYINHEDADYFVFNADARFGGTQRFFTWDIAAGLGAPLATKKYDDVVLAVEKVNWHAGTTLLIGNNYTTALFAQAGVYNAIFKSSEKRDPINLNDIYFLFEPRFIGKVTKTHLTAYYLPQKTVDNLIFVNDKLGVNFNIFSDANATRNTGMDFGLNMAFTIRDLGLAEVSSIPSAIMAGNFNIHITPYLTSKIMKGELNAMLSFNVMEFFQTQWAKSLQLNIAYKTSF